jgi:hypothetical protein
MGTEIVMESMLNTPQGSIVTVSKNRYVHQPEKLFSWTLRPKYPAPLCRLESDVGIGNTTQIWRGLYKDKRSGYIYATNSSAMNILAYSLRSDNISAMTAQRIASVLSPFEAAQFTGPIHEEFTSQGGKLTGTGEFLGMPVEIWRLLKNGVDMEMYVAAETDYPWVLKKTISMFGLLVAKEEVTSLKTEQEITLDEFILPSHIQWPRSVEVIGPASLTK